MVMMLMTTSMISTHIQTGGVLQAQQCFGASLTLAHYIQFALERTCAFEKYIPIR